MQINCVFCGNEVNLDHHVFLDYQGPIKCFSCGKKMEIITCEGNLLSTEPSALEKVSRFQDLV